MEQKTAWNEYEKKISKSWKNYPTVELLPLVESAFALGQKRFRLRAKTFSTKGEK